MCGAAAPGPSGKADLQTKEPNCPPAGLDMRYLDAETYLTDIENPVQLHWHPDRENRLKTLLEERTKANH